MNPTAASLAQLRDIHLPAAVGLWPPAPGWWLLGLLLLLILGLGLWWLWRLWQRRGYRRQALRQLRIDRHAYHRDRDLPALLTRLSVLLRRTALTAYPDQPVAGLSGEDWRAFLRQCSRLSDFDGPLGDALVQAPYRPHPEADAAAVVALVERWIRRHRSRPC